MSSLLSRIATLVVFCLPAGFAAAASVDIPFTERTLANGLRVIVHEDHKAPIVAVNVWYHVGSKDEGPGKTGFAHLFEHLMFNGTENFDNEYFLPFAQVGATDQNGTTYFDRTNYFQTVPSTALDTALWMESDRMGHLLGAVTEEKLESQRGVVQNEKRQSENQPYGLAFERIVEGVFPKGHPYSWLPIGSMEDLNAASLDDVKTWFETYYGPNNAVLVIAGDVDTEEAFARAEHFFGDIEPGPSLTRQKVWVPTLDGVSREILEDRNAKEARIYKVWPVPEWANEDADTLGLVASVLGSGKNSRLYKRLVYDDQIATGVGVSPLFLEIAGFMYISATVAESSSIEEVEAAIDEELARFIARGPTRDELKRVRTQYLSGFVRGVEKVGGFSGKSNILAENAVYGDDPGFYKVSLDRIEAATRESVRAAAERWLPADRQYILEIHPRPTLAANDEGADRSEVPLPESFPDSRFDDFERVTLDNGLSLVVARRDAVPVVQMQLLLDAGYAADQFAPAGTSSLTMAMLDEGTSSRDALEISDELGQLGASLGTGANIDASFVSLNTLSSELDAALDIFADVVLNPTFPDNELARLRKLRSAAIEREKTQPVQLALRVLPELMYGKDHAYGQPLTGNGTQESLAAISRDTLVSFHEQWFKPNNATLIVVGDVTLDDIRGRIERHFGSWKAGDVPAKNIATVDLKPEKVYLIDRPGSIQSVILAGHVAPPKANANEFAIQAMNEVLGGDFTSRVNMNLREDKDWAYGAYTLFISTRGQRPFLAYAPVQSDKTAASMAELKLEIERLLGEKPATTEELDRVMNQNTLSLPGRWETAGSVASSLAEIVRFGLPDDYWRTYAQRIRSVTLDDVGAAADEVLKPDNMLWVVVGDRATIEDDIRALGYDDIEIVDADGNAVAPNES